jgi:hypothetical protein
MTLHLTRSSPAYGTLQLLGLELLLLRSKKRHFNRLYGDTQKCDFRPPEDKYPCKSTSRVLYLFQILLITAVKTT